MTYCEIVKQNPLKCLTPALKCSHISVSKSVDDYRTLHVSACAFILGTTTSTVGVTSINKAKTVNPQECTSISGPHSFVSLSLPSACSEHWAYNAEGSLGISLNVVSQIFCFIGLFLQPTLMHTSI